MKARRRHQTGEGFFGEPHVATAPVAVGNDASDEVSRLEGAQVVGQQVAADAQCRSKHHGRAIGVPEGVDDGQTMRIAQAVRRRAAPQPDSGPRPTSRRVIALTVATKSHFSRVQSTAVNIRDGASASASSK